MGYIVPDVARKLHSFLPRQEAPFPISVKGVSQPLALAHRGVELLFELATDPRRCFGRLARLVAQLLLEGFELGP